MRLDDLPTAVYRLYDADRRLLYIGMTADLDTRLTAHRHEKPWWREVRWASVEWFDDRPTAARVEADAIKADDPPYNRLGTSRFDKRAMVDTVTPTGVRDLSMTLFVTRTAEVLDHVIRGGVVCLLKYKRPHAYLVPPREYEAGRRNRELVAALQKDDPELYARLLEQVA